MLALFSLIFGSITLVFAQTYVEKTNGYIEGGLCDGEDYICGEATILSFYHIDKNGNIHLDGGVVQGGKAVGISGAEYRWISQSININDISTLPPPSDSNNGVYSTKMTYHLRLICKGNESVNWSLKLIIHFNGDLESKNIIHANTYSSGVICK